MAKGNSFIKDNGKGLVVVIAVGILLIVGYALGLTVTPTFWKTENVITSGRLAFVIAGAAAIIGVVLFLVLAKVFPNDIVLHIITLVIGVGAVFALTAMWYNCVVEVAYIYGEGNLELGNASAVNGSRLLFAASGCYVLGVFGTVLANALGLVLKERLP